MSNGEETAVYPYERINLKYSPTIKGGEDLELPFKQVFLGDYSFAENDKLIEEREPIEIKSAADFSKAMEGMHLEADVEVQDHFSKEPERQIQARLRFHSLADLTPEGVAEQVPEIQEQLRIRGELTELKALISQGKSKAEINAKINRILGGDSDALGSLLG